MASVGNRVQAFLNQFSGDSRAVPGASQGFDIAGVQRLPFQRPGQGPNRQLQQWDSGPGRSGTYKGFNNNYQFLDDEMPNPFGGGGAPYMPGASLPGRQGSDIAAIPHPGAYPYGQPDKFDAWEKQYQQHQQEQQRIKSWLNNEPPNPFGGGSAAYRGPA
jgi:hypothetical protein